MQLVEISKAQDVEAGDGTTSVVVIAGAFLKACEILLDKGLHANMISEGFQKALEFSLATLKKISLPIDICDRETLL
jgi:T-complex protein 1 subunit delta